MDENKNQVKLPSSFDVIGDIAILEIPEGSKEKKKLVAERLLEMNKHIKTVVEKLSKREGKLRLRKYEFLAGENKTETLHKEYGYLLKLDPTKVYFSPREATERQRVAWQVKPGEVVMLMFAGIGPYAIAIAKKQPGVRKIVAIELNPVAVEYMKENIRINKLSDKILPVLGDVREKCKEWYGKCDRVVMPLPLGAENFLDIAIGCLKPEGGIIHFYSWGKEGKLYENAVRLVEEVCKKAGKWFELIGKRKVLPYKPRTFKICLDLKIK